MWGIERCQEQCMRHCCCRHNVTNGLLQQALQMPDAASAAELDACLAELLHAPDSRAQGSSTMVSNVQALKSVPAGAADPGAA